MEGCPWEGRPQRWRSRGRAVGMEGGPAKEGVDSYGPTLSNMGRTWPTNRQIGLNWAKVGHQKLTQWTNVEPKTGQNRPGPN